MLTRADKLLNGGDDHLSRLKGFRANSYDPYYQVTYLVLFFSFMVSGSLLSIA